MNWRRLLRIYVQIALVGTISRQHRAVLPSCPHVRTDVHISLFKPDSLREDIVHLILEFKQAVVRGIAGTIDHDWHLLQFSGRFIIHD